ncbi:MAG: polysaccharide biosynthesis/export family protein [Candidatus Neomarinimicrobiota bacterium]
MKQIIILILILSFAYTQNIGNIYSEETTDYDTNSMLVNQDIDLTNYKNLTYTPVEKSINPDTYTLGPGDLLGINILSAKNISLPIRINPVGEIMIPSVGILNVNGISVTEARIKIADYITDTALKNAIINVTLLDIRRFKIQVLGAIQNPGFIYVTPIDKVYDAILQSGGVQKFAHPGIVQIIRDGNTIEVKLKEYLSGTDISQNLSLKVGDVIFIPFSDFANSAGLISGEYNKHQVIVYGFVNRSGGSNSFRYFPGYTSRDYIAMAGGTKEQGASYSTGNINKTTIYRSDGTKIKNAIDEFVLPGDMIEVPPSLLYQIVGGDGIIRTLASIASTAFIVWRISIE